VYNRASLRNRSRKGELGKLCANLEGRQKRI
jgi:hypothetical protein